MTGRHLALLRRTSPLGFGALLILILVLGVALSDRPGIAHATPIPRATALALAEKGLTVAESEWVNRSHHWYNEVLADRAKYPQATVWGAVPLFEALDAVAAAAPTRANLTAVERFARGAENYWDPTMGGYAPYPGDRGHALTWFDDNGWWGLAFFDAYRVTHQARLLTDAERAFTFIATQGWDTAGGGGMWWNTAHPYLAGEPLAAGSLLGADLYSVTGNALYRTDVDGWISWADQHFAAGNGLYWRTGTDPTPTPYVEGTMIEAQELLCQAGDSARCSEASALASAAMSRFEARLNMGPQYDVIYLHQMLAFGQATGQSQWLNLAELMADDALAKARTGPNTYLRAWDGTPMTEHQAQPNMLQTQAATVELFAWLANFGPSP
ncbi:MAG TPA: glycoside hydrolase family 76 protein [Solirubrobacteraceae bacterium]|nr:glycoside hydrolase family 76 protein [Solirubrobacteraceae bacterium]